MEQYLPFISENMLLFCAFGFVAVSLILVEIYRRSQGPKMVSPLLATPVINDEQSIIIDVRPSGEFKSGYIVGSTNISSSEFKEHIEKISENKNVPILLCCKNGTQAPTHGRELIAAGYGNVKVLSGGIMSWQSENMPLEKA